MRPFFPLFSTTCFLLDIEPRIGDAGKNFDTVPQREDQAGAAAIVLRGQRWSSRMANRNVLAIGTSAGGVEAFALSCF
jgi:hypothetical protein